MLSTLNPQPSTLKARIAYLLAASHSGSTLLAMLLGAHPQARTVGELKATSLGDPDLYRCSCGELIRQCDFWKQVTAAMMSRGFPYDPTQAGTCIHEVPSRYAKRLLKPLYCGSTLELARDLALSFSPAWHSQLASTRERNATLVETLLELTRAKVIIDSSKQALRLKYLLADPRLEISVVRVIRDGRAVSLTYMDEWTFADSADPSRRGGGSGVKRKSARENMWDAAREWRRSNEAADCLVARLPRTQWTEVRYEDLCANLEGTLRRLCGFLELDPDRINLDFRSVDQHVIGNGMRFDTTSEIRLDERWRTQLSENDLEVFETVAGVMNRRYGYK